MKKINKVMKKNSFLITAIVISILTLIIGTLAVGFLKAFVIVGIIDVILYFIPKLTNKKGKKKTTKKEKKKKMKIFLIVLLSLVIVGILGIVAFAIYIVGTAPDFNPDNLLKKDSTVLYDSNGEIITKLGTQKREKVEYEQLPQVLIDAIVATEDSRFFQHNGFDAARFIKASASQLIGHGGGGASTLTMQISKNAYTDTVSSGFEGIKRKFTDIYLSIFKIEKQYTKQDILEFYVNSYYMGAGAYGVQQASLTYFNKPISEINLAEAAMLAGMFQSPDAYDPYINPKSTESRRQTVLYLMERHGYITSEEREIASKLTVDDIVKKSTNSTNDYQGFIDTVVAEVKERTGINPYTTPMLIYTTMDRSKQDYINDIVEGRNKNYKWENDVVQAGIVMLKSSTGDIVAVGAGRNKKGESTFNFATMTKKQIGSTAKPLYDYGPGIEYNNWSTYQLFADEPHSYSDGVNVNNVDGRYKGLLTMRESLKQSRNIPAIKAFQSLKSSDILSFVKSLGLSPDMSQGILFETHAIGGYTGESPLTIAAAYAAFSNGGYYVEPRSFTKIVYRDTDEVYEVKTAPQKVMSEETAYMISDMLVTTASYTTGRTTVNGITYGAKTGTTDYDNATKKAYKLPSNAVNDSWIAGISPDYSMALWYGYEKINSKYTNKLGSGQNVRLFKAIINGTLSGTKNFTKPDGVVEVTIEKETNPAMLPSEYTPDSMKITELFKSGTEPTEVSTRYSKLNSVTNLKNTINDNAVTLSWNPIQTPDAISSDAIDKLASSLFSNETYKNNFINSRLNYNSNNIGTLTYNIYSKGSDGTLTYITTTSNSTVDIPLPTKTTTYVVKASYTIFKSNISDGIETTVNVSLPSEVDPTTPDDNTTNNNNNNEITNN